MLAEAERFKEEQQVKETRERMGALGACPELPLEF